MKVMIRPAVVAGTRGRAAPAAVHVVSAAAQAAARAFWTSRRMADAMPLQEKTASGLDVPAFTIPSPTEFAGVPAVGALFSTTGTKAHFCTASVVVSRSHDVVLTAAHCVYGSTYAT